MTFPLRPVLLLSLLAAAANATFFMPMCPLVPGKYPFDFDKFQGDWVLAASNDNPVQAAVKCRAVTFPAFASQEDDKKVGEVLTARVTGTNVADDTPVAFETVIQPVVSDKIGSLYIVSRREGSSEYNAVFKASIIATDYTTFSVTLSCKADFDGEAKKFTRTLFAEVWNRKGVTLSKDTMDSLVTLLSSYGVDPSKIKTVEQCA
ncbi:hypothetical protein ONE63_008293 [Megalurothrips usitatus]|uniref:Uncharacterized protein n=1 Tax=Megalurothrips usitatus TaxID=439358 RepID=A0AAV7XP14_9NEOP|nr:hypothetical protein ONE63_008293 [Megalurothrips usitatus]